MTTSVLKKRIVVFSSTLLITLIAFIVASEFTLSQNRFQVFAQSPSPTEPHQLFLPILDSQSSDDSVLATTLQGGSQNIGPVLRPPTSISTSSPSPFTLTWEIQVSFDSNNNSNPIIAHWIMNEIAPNGTVNVVTSIDISPNCTIVGNVSIDDIVAYFNGGYITCIELPNFQDEANKYTSNMRCGCQFDTETPPWVAAKFEVSGVTTPFYQPLVILQNEQQENVLQYGMELDDEFAWRTNLQFVNGLTFSSTPFALDADPITTFSGFNAAQIFSTLDLNTGGSHAFLNIHTLINDANSSGSGTFLSWHSQGSNTTSVNDPAYPPLTPTMLYIGKNSTTGELFKGEIEKIIIDPGCQTN